MQKHIFQPIPKLDGLSPLASREDRLKTIIANLEKHERDVKASIAAEGLQKLRNARKEATHADAMEIESNQPMDYGRLPSNLRAPYRQGSGDPCMPPIDPNHLANAAAEQARGDPQLAAVLEAFGQLREYDTLSSKAKEPYIKALERQRAQ
ncbi:hypothetical protein KC340_g12470 [Hortaea werneckii]|nr:hypothetical protein KC342_g9027 [Hortaea werneckii]KAI7098263.1 hypothetical protein KC339_g9081 [Hortaea werneckii]KAI7205313.1 hypothetical protein KC365_g17676 [Hortaea werneckii]KAI7303525.1 hypothetical protein KC340_g12470 [Hortaea werneckii]KAI7396976.1 hypothetical protein KC328_g5110 [Hortaea werneckii]